MRYLSYKILNRVLFHVNINHRNNLCFGIKIQFFNTGVVVTNF